MILMKINREQYRVARRCFFVSTMIVILPLALIYLVIKEQTFKLVEYQFRNIGAYFEADPILFSNLSLQTLPDDAVRTLPPNKLEMVEDRMKERQNFLAQKCSELGLDLIGKDPMHTPNPYQFLVNHRYHIIWCNVFKAASTSWMHNFNILAGYSPEILKNVTHMHFVISRIKYPRVSLDELYDAQKDSITFIIVRHPFERLLSAYRDKFIFSLPNTFYNNMGKRIIKAYRKNKAKLHAPQHPTFSEFVRWLLDKVRNNNHIDEHLVPATKFCTPCLIKFDVIAKFETLEEDQIYLIEKAGLANVIMPERKNIGIGNKTLELMKTYYSQLTRKQLDGLYSYMRYDFEVFGYNATPYFSVVKTK